LAFFVWQKIDEPLTERSHSVDQWNERVHQSASSAVAGDPTSVLVPNNGDPATQSNLWKQVSACASAKLFLC